jgi:hypothetical protein
VINTNVNDVVRAKQTNIMTATLAYGNHRGKGVAVAMCQRTVPEAKARVKAVDALVTSSILTPIRSPNTDIALKPCVMSATTFIWE